MSLCSGLTSDTPLREMQARFARHIVTWEQFSAIPELTANPNLVVRMNGRYFSWQVIGPVLLAQAAFGRPLPDKACGPTLYICTANHAAAEKLVSTFMARKGTSKWWWRLSKPADAPISVHIQPLHDAADRCDRRHRRGAPA